jgi:Ca-activated chloride channel family protein
MFERPEMLWLLLLTPAMWWPARRLWLRDGDYLSALALATLRTLVFWTLVALVAGFQLRSIVRADRLALVAVIDQSRSLDSTQVKVMKREVRAVARLMDARDRIAVLAFGADVHLLAPPQAPAQLGALEGDVDGSATDISSALTVAMGLFPSGAEKKLWLLSDGNQTRGDAFEEIPSLQARQIQVFASIPPPVSIPRASMVGLFAPERVRSGFDFTLRLDVESEAPQEVDARLSVGDDSERSIERMIKLRPGLNRFALPYVFGRPGDYLLRAALSVGPQVHVLNPTIETSVSVLPAPRVLVVSTESPSDVLRVLTLRGYQVERTKPVQLPREAQGLLAYQAVVLDDVLADTLTPETEQALASYVADYGGGLIATGGTLRDYRFKGSVLEKALPVNFQPQPPPPQREPVAIYLLIDRSNSMGYNSRYPTVRDEERIRYAKQAALAMLRQLDDADFVGVIAFDSDPYVLMPLQPLGGQRAALQLRIQRLEPGGGTDFKQALEIAMHQMMATDLRSRQVILLTDGDTNREYHDHDQLMADFARLKIPVSTIRIGPDTENLKLLQDFADATHGVFYRVDDVSALPELLVRLGRQTTDSQTPRHLRVSLGKRNSIVAGIDPNALPSLEFFSLSDAKKRASVPLDIEYRGAPHPLVAAWQYGLGRASVFAADPESSSSIRWVQWDRYAQFWSQLVSWTMRPQPYSPFDLRLTTEHDGGLKISAEKADSTPTGDSLFCRIVSPRTAFEIPMTPTNDAVYEGESSALPAGRYSAYLIRKAGDHEQTLAARAFVVSAMTPGALDELRLQPPNRELLGRLARLTGGGLNLEPAVMLKRHGPRVPVYHSAHWLLIPLAIAFLLTEVFLRRHLLGAP